jgi:bifunctional non-homologous end joining protein LigD
MVKMANLSKKPAGARRAAADKAAALARPSARIEPVEKQPSSPKGRHEIKWDGYRVCVVVDGGQATVRARRGHDWTHRFKSVEQAEARLAAQCAATPRADAQRK